MAQEKTGAALLTVDLLSTRKRMGRPPSGNAVSNKERQRKYREKHMPIAIGSRMSTTIAELAAAHNLTSDQVTAHLVRFALCNKNWKKTGFPE